MAATRHPRTQNQRDLVRVCLCWGDGGGSSDVPEVVIARGLGEVIVPRLIECLILGMDSAWSPCWREVQQRLLPVHGLVLRLPLLACAPSAFVSLVKRWLQVAEGIAEAPCVGHGMLLTEQVALKRLYSAGCLAQDVVDSFLQHAGDASSNDLAEMMNIQHRLACVIQRNTGDGTELFLPKTDAATPTAATWAPSVPSRSGTPCLNHVEEKASIDPYLVYQQPAEDDKDSPGELASTSTAHLNTSTRDAGADIIKKTATPCIPEFVSLVTEVLLESFGGSEVVAQRLGGVLEAEINNLSLNCVDGPRAGDGGQAVAPVVPGNHRKAEVLVRLLHGVMQVADQGSPVPGLAKQLVRCILRGGELQEEARHTVRWWDLSLLRVSPHAWIA